MQNKKCTKCGENKALIEFYKANTGRHNIRGDCKKCFGSQAKKYQQSDKGKKAHRKGNQKYEKSEKGKIAHKRYDQSPLGKISRARRKSRRRIQELNTRNDLTLLQWDQILRTQRNKCNHCGVNFGSKLPTKDHIIPVSRGGGLTKNNVQALCGSCNSSKGNKTVTNSVYISNN